MSTPSGGPTELDQLRKDFGGRWDITIDGQRMIHAKTRVVPIGKLPASRWAWTVPELRKQLAKFEAHATLTTAANAALRMRLSGKKVLTPGPEASLRERVTAGLYIAVAAIGHPGGHAADLVAYLTATREAKSSSDLTSARKPDSACGALAFIDQFTPLRAWVPGDDTCEGCEEALSRRIGPELKPDPAP